MSKNRQEDGHFGAGKLAISGTARKLDVVKIEQRESDFSNAEQSN